MMFKIIHNVETGEIVEQELSVDELAQWEIDQANAKAEAAAKAQAKAEAQAKRQALLDKLGISEEEAKLLLS